MSVQPTYGDGNCLWRAAALALGRYASRLNFGGLWLCEDGYLELKASTADAMRLHAATWRPVDPKEWIRALAYASGAETSDVYPSDACVRGVAAATGRWVAVIDVLGDNSAGVYIFPSGDEQPVSCSITDASHLYLFFDTYDSAEYLRFHAALDPAPLVFVRCHNIELKVHYDATALLVGHQQPRPAAASAAPAASASKEPAAATILPLAVLAAAKPHAAALAGATRYAAFAAPANAAFSKNPQPLFPPGLQVAGSHQPRRRHHRHHSSLCRNNITRNSNRSSNSSSRSKRNGGRRNGCSRSSGRWQRAAAVRSRP